MGEEQLRLFAAPKPLLERLGSAFFKSIPAQPGIYLMFDADGRILYVGQSGNLRARLGSYKNARPERCSRKVIRLIHATASITWETCPSPAAARLRENDFLRTYRPRFNAINTYPQAYPYLRLLHGEGSFVLSVSPQVDPQAENYGAFKSRAWLGYASLIRLLHAVIHRPLSLHAFPCHLLSERPPRRMTFPQWAGCNTLLRSLRAFLQGEASELLDYFRSGLPGRNNRFEDDFYENELQCLNEFFEFSARRNFQLRQRLPARNHSFLGQAELDDLLVQELL